jgi:hypothetical protein
VWQGGALCRPEMSEGKRGWACLVCFVGVQVRLASWGRTIISWSQMIIGKRTQLLDLSVYLFRWGGFAWYRVVLRTFYKKKKKFKNLEKVALRKRKISMQMLVQS